MHVQEGKTIKPKASSPKHAYTGKHTPKHMHETQKPKKKGNLGIGAFVCALIFVLSVAVFGDFSFTMLPFGAFCLFYAIYSAMNRKTFFSVSAIVLSAIGLFCSAGYGVWFLFQYFGLI